MFPAGAGLWGGWAEAQDPTAPRGPWPQHLLPAQTAPGGLRAPEPGGAQGHQQRGGGGGRAGEGSWDRLGPPVPVAKPSSRIAPRHVGREWKKRPPPSPPIPRPRPLQPRDPWPHRPGHRSPPAAARTTRGSVRKVMPSPVGPMVAGGSGGTPAPPRPVPPQCSRC